MGAGQARSQERGADIDNRPSFGSGGADGLRKEAMKPDEEADEWGLDLDSKPAKSGLGGRLLGRKPKKDEDDLDNFLDVLEAKRGIESSKP